MDIIKAGQTNVSIDFAVRNVYAITGFRATYSRKSYGGASSAYETPVSADLTALSDITDAHEDNKGLYWSTVSTDGSKYLVRVDFPDAAFASGADEVICSLYDDGNEEIAQRIISLVGQVQDLYGGKIWLNSPDGTFGTEPGINGTADKPVDNMNDAMTLANDLNITEIRASNNSSVTPGSTLTNLYVSGHNYDMALGTLAYNGVEIEGANLTGVATSAAKDLVLRNCLLTNVTIPGGTKVIDCILDGVTTLGDNDENYTFRNCSPLTPDGATISLLADDTDVVITGWEGDLTIDYLDADKLYITGRGDITEGANCVIGNFTVVGLWTLNDISTTTPYYTMDSRLNTNTFDGAAASEITAIKDKTDNLPHSLKKNTAVANYHFVMFDATTGDPKPGLTVTADRWLADDAGATPMAGSIVEIAYGIYRIDIQAVDTNAGTGSWIFSAAGAKDTIITFITEA